MHTEQEIADERHRRQRQAGGVVFLIAASVILFRSHVYVAPDRVRLADVPLVSLDGRPVAGGQLAGRTLLVNFWAPWCPPCRAEMPALERLQQQFPEARVVGLETDVDAIADARELARASGVTYLLARPSTQLHSVFGTVSSLPTTLFISRSGTVLRTVTGGMQEPEMRRYLEEALASP